MSTHEEIQEVYLQDIVDKTHRVINKHGMAVMLDGWNGQVFDLWGWCRKNEGIMPLKIQKSGGLP
jgi:hypothetical protein